jgi:hypothetical protein
MPQLCGPEVWDNFWYAILGSVRKSRSIPLPGLVPGTPVLAAEIANDREDVDGRVKPGQARQ